MSNTISQAFLITAEDMSDPERAADVLNEVLARIADRLDALQGTRGTADLRNSLRVLDTNDVVVSGFYRSDPTT